jgi:predicted RNase H-like HicB family nuclease
MLVKFELYNDGEWWCARGIGVDIFTQGETLDELMENIKEAVEVHFEGRTQYYIPRHSKIAKGTRNDILSKVSLWNNIVKDDLIEMLKSM